jgi:lipopolysaccharide/colanic/teichoic acid biosynthesis glycosyltransferase
MWVKRCTDFIFAFCGFIILLPVLLIVAIAIKVSSRGPIFFKQKRVGKSEVIFEILKFRTMRIDAEATGQLTVGASDNRITKIGYYLRKYKLDELPQLYNVIIGNMSIVGPRPEVPFYVQYYSDEQRKVFDFKPGITDYASIEFSNENELLAVYTNPEEAYINIIMPQKLKLNLHYIATQSWLGDMKIILNTIKKIAL